MFNIDEIKKILEDYSNQFSSELDDYYKNLQKQLEKSFVIEHPISIFQDSEKSKEKVNQEKENWKNEPRTRTHGWLTPLTSYKHVEQIENGGEIY